MKYLIALYVIGTPIALMFNYAASVVSGNHRDRDDEIVELEAGAPRAS